MEPQSFDFNDAQQFSQQENEQSKVIKNYKNDQDFENYDKQVKEKANQGNIKIEDQQNIKQQNYEIVQFPNLEQMQAIQFTQRKDIKAYVNAYPQDFTYKVVPVSNYNSKSQKYWLKCSFEKCQSTLVFEWCEEKVHFVLKYSQVKHNHGYQKQKMARLEKQIKEYMEQKGLNHINNQIRKKYGLGNRRLKLLKQKLNFQGKVKAEQPQVKKETGAPKASRCRQKLNQGVKYIEIDPKQNSYPKTIIIYDNLMQRLFQKYHDVLYLSQSEINLKYEQQMVSKKIVLLSGIDQNNFLVLFAGIITDFDHTFVIEAINRFFSEMNLKKAPQSIITRDQQFLNDVVQGMLDLQEYSQLTHFFDRREYFEKFKKTITASHFMNKEYMKKAQEIIISYQEKQIRQILEIYRKTNEMGAIQLFEQYSQKLCNYYMNRSFYGLECSIPNKAFWNKYICYRTTKQQINLRMFGSIICYFNWRMENQYEIFIASQELTKQYNDKFLQEVRVRLNQPVFNRFLEEYEESSSMKVKKIGAGVFKVDKVWQVINFWCICSARKHSGIPCCHQLAVLRQLNMSYLPYINRRWFLDKTVATLQEHEVQVEKQILQFNSKVKKQAMKFQQGVENDENNENANPLKRLRFKLQEEVEIPSFEFY